MQINFFILKISLLSFFLLSGCREKLPGEDFAVIPQSHFLRLADTPAYPALPSAQDTAHLQQTLMTDSLTSQQDKDMILNQIENFEVSPTPVFEPS